MGRAIYCYRTECSSLKKDKVGYGTVPYGYCVHREKKKHIEYNTSQHTRKYVLVLYASPDMEYKPQLLNVLGCRKVNVAAGDT